MVTLPVPMGKAKFFGGELDRIYLSRRQIPDFRVYVWNPNRTTLAEVVLGKARSPRYDLTPWVIRCSYNENIVWENNDDAVSSNCVLEVTRDPDATPIPISERTLIDGAPVRIYQGDERVRVEDWIPLFTGVIRGNPTMVEFGRAENTPDTMTVQCVGREENYLNTKVTARSYEKGTDVGKAAVETAIEFMQLDRREIDIGFQSYPIGHSQAQLVDVEVLKGIYEILFTTGKKPKFDSEGFLVAADTDLDKPAAREHPNMDAVAQVARVQQGGSLYNSVRLLGLDDELTKVVERRRRLAHGEITAGWFVDEVKHTVHFSEDKGRQTGGRRAQNTHLNAKLQFFGALQGESVDWEPKIEEDGFTVFKGDVVFKTHYAPWIQGVLLGEYAIYKIVEVVALATVVGLPVAATYNALASSVLVRIFLAMMTMGRVEWEVEGQPFTNVYQQLAATAQLLGILTKDIKELELRNDWLYDIVYMEGRVRELLRRELIKSWSYELTMIDDPLIEVDDVIKIEDRRYYVTSVRKNLTREGAPEPNMTLTAWRVA